MLAPSTTKFTALAALLTTVSAHGFVKSITAGGKQFPGGDPSLKFQNPLPAVAGWLADNLDNGFVSPSAYSSDDIICHKIATNGKAYVDVTAGESIDLQWNTWPESHKGPVIDYLADCGGDCTTISKASLKFSKIAEKGYVSGSNPGTFASDELIANGNSWKFTVPKDLKAGEYVLRHEIIALHSAGQTDGAQNYPQCINLKVSGSGTSSLTGGVSATEFYKADDAGIKFNLYTTFTSYPIPGPQLSSLGSGSGNAPAPAPSSSASASSAAEATTPAATPTSSVADAPAPVPTSTASASSVAEAPAPVPTPSSSEVAAEPATTNVAVVTPSATSSAAPTAAPASRPTSGCGAGYSHRHRKHAKDVLRD